MPTILINGIDSLLGAKVAQILSTHTDVQVIGLGLNAPTEPVGHTEVLTRVLDGQQLVELLNAKQVDTVIQLDIAGEEHPAAERETAVRQNVLGSMQLLGACAATQVRRVVVRSSTLVYGATHEHPAFISEELPIAKSGKPGVIRDYIEVDAFATDFAHKYPHLAVVVLRCASLIGAGIQSPLTRYLAQPNPRTCFGFDPRIQLLHPSDAAAAFAQIALDTPNGVFNLAGDAPIKLVQAIRLTGRQPLALLEPLLAIADVLGHTPQLTDTWPFEQNFLRYSCIADTRRVRQAFGWTPHYTADAILRTPDVIPVASVAEYG